MLEKITKFVLNKWVFITLIVIEVCGIVALFWAQAKQDSYPYRGIIIDNEFLDALAMNEFYEAIQLALVAFVLFFFAAIIFYAVAFVKHKRGTFIPKDRGALLGSLMFMGTAIAFTIPFIYDLHSRGSERPFVMVENIVDKQIDYYKSGKDYFLVFTSGSNYIVSKKTFPQFHIGSTFYTVYQGKSLIHIFPVGKYTLKKD